MPSVPTMQQGWRYIFSRFSSSIVKRMSVIRQRFFENKSANASTSSSPFIAAYSETRRPTASFVTAASVIRKFFAPMFLIGFSQTSVCSVTAFRSASTPSFVPSHSDSAGMPMDRKLGGNADFVPADVAV